MASRRPLDVGQLHRAAPGHPGLRLAATTADAPDDNGRRNSSVGITRRRGDRQAGYVWKASPACCGLPRYGWPLLTPKLAFVIGGKLAILVFVLYGADAPIPAIPVSEIRP